MNVIVKVCKKHGDLTINDLVKSGTSRGEQKYRCKKCLKILHANHYQNNKKELYEKHREYKNNNREKFREFSKKYRKQLKIMNDNLSTNELKFRSLGDRVRKLRPEILKRKLVYLLWDIDKVIRNEKYK